MADALTVGATYSSVQGRARPLPMEHVPTRLTTGRALLSYPHAARPSLCPSRNGRAPTQRCPFPLLAGIKAQTLCEDITHLR
jgi:hypothetical protein